MMRLLDSATGVVGDVREGVFQRGEHVAPVSTPTEKVLYCIEAPLRACQWVADGMAAVTIPMIRPLVQLTPSWISSKYEGYLESKVDQCAKKVDPSGVISGTLASAGSAVYKTVASYVPEYFKGAFGFATDYVKETAINTGKAALKNSVRAVHGLAANEAARQLLGFAYGIGVQHVLYSYLNQYASEYVAGHTLLTNSLKYVRYGLMGYVYGPTVYKACKFAKGCWDAKQNVAAMNKALDSPKAKEVANAVGAKFGVSGDVIRKAASTVLVGADLGFLAPYIPDMEKLFEAIARAQSES